MAPVLVQTSLSLSDWLHKLPGFVCFLFCALLLDLLKLLLSRITLWNVLSLAHWYVHPTENVVLLNVLSFPALVLCHPHALPPSLSLLANVPFHSDNVPEIYHLEMRWFFSFWSEGLCVLPLTAAALCVGNWCECSVSTSMAWRWWCE